MRALVITGLSIGTLILACGSSNNGPSNSPGGSSGSGGSSSGGSGSGGNTGVTNGTSPTIGGCSVFPADNPWNTRVDGSSLTVNAMSATYISNMSPTSHLHPDWGDWTQDHYGIPWETVDATQAAVPITFEASADQSDPGPYPFPSDAKVEGGANSGGDQHVLVLQTGKCILYETFNSKYVGPGWTADSGAKFDLSSNALRTDGWTSADAAGLPILPGLVKLSEVNAGKIEHAIRLTVGKSQQGYIHPAVHAAGDKNTSLPPMGLRLRLKASFDTSALTGPTLIIATAMKEYGLLVADNGSSWYISGDSDDGWTPLMDDLVSGLEKIHGSDFEALDTGTISTAGL